jgi:hypothetical protein
MALVACAHILILIDQFAQSSPRMTFLAYKIKPRTIPTKEL